MAVRITEMLPIWGHLCPKETQASGIPGWKFTFCRPRAGRISWSRVTGAGQMGEDTVSPLSFWHISWKDMFRSLSLSLSLSLSSSRGCSTYRAMCFSPSLSLSHTHMCPVHCDLSKCELDNQVWGDQGQGEYCVCLSFSVLPLTQSSEGITKCTHFSLSLSLSLFALSASVQSWCILCMWIGRSSLAFHYVHCERSLFSLSFKAKRKGPWQDQSQRVSGDR